MLVRRYIIVLVQYGGVAAYIGHYYHREFIHRVYRHNVPFQNIIIMRE